MDELLARILSELQILHAEIAEVRHLLSPPIQRTLPFPNPPVTTEEAEQLVTLDQAAAMVKRAKKSMKYYKDTMPKPRTVGRRGQPHLWRWDEIRPWLEKTFGFTLPERFPH